MHFPYLVGASLEYVVSILATCWYIMGTSRFRAGGVKSTIWEIWPPPAGGPPLTGWRAADCLTGVGGWWWWWWGMISYGFVLLCYGFRLICNRRHAPDFCTSYGSLWCCIVFSWFCFVFTWFKSSDLARSLVILWFPMFLHCVPLVLRCFWMILIVGSHPILGDLMMAYGFALFSNAFAMFLIDLNRQPSPDLQLS